MAKEWLHIGPCPGDEECAQVGREGYAVQAKKECRAYINQLRRERGEEPEGASLGIKSNPHENGTYYEVVCYYEDDNRTAAEYAFDCEGSSPAKWDTAALIELGLMPKHRLAMDVLIDLDHARKSMKELSSSDHDAALDLLDRLLECWKERWPENRTNMIVAKVPKAHPDVLDELDLEHPVLPENV